MRLKPPDSQEAKDRRRCARTRPAKRPDRTKGAVTGQAASGTPRRRSGSIQNPERERGADGVQSTDWRDLIRRYWLAASPLNRERALWLSQAAMGGRRAPSAEAFLDIDQVFTSLAIGRSVSFGILLVSAGVDDPIRPCSIIHQYIEELATAEPQPPAKGRKRAKA